MSLRVLCASDLHIGFRAYERLSSGGINERSRDVARTFTVLVDRAIALAPDVITIAGDVFHHSRPDNNAIVFAYSQFARLTKALPATKVIAISGNHDSNKTSDAGNILPLFRNAGVLVADREWQRLAFPGLELSVLCVPDVIGGKRPELIPDRAAKYNLLVLHGEAEGMPRNGGKPKDEVSTDAMHAGAWDYCALGHWHVYQQIAPNAFYSGSIDYCSSDVWDELRVEKEAGLTGKGFIVRDLESGAHEFHPLPCSRVHLDLPAIDLENPSPAEVNAAIRAAVESIDGGIKGKIVRLIVNLPSRAIKDGLDHAMIRTYKNSKDDGAMAFNLDVRIAKAVESPISMMIRGVTVPGARGPMLGLHERLRGSIASRTLPPDVDRSEITALASHYLDKAGEADDRAPLVGELDAIPQTAARKSA